MHIRDNVRRRRRERIMRLLAQQQDITREAGDTGNLPEAWNPESPAGPLSANAREPRQAAAPEGFSGIASHRTENPVRETDPEKWWKEQQKRLNRAGPVWQGAGGLRSSSANAEPPDDDPSPFVRFARGFAVRLAAAALIFAASWIWFATGLPGSQEAREWTAVAVSRDMDFAAAEAWYARTFGGSPSFLPAFRSKGDTKAVSGGWKRDEAVVPVVGRMVQTFAQDGTGVRIAAAGGDVRAVYAGRVLQVAEESGGKATIVLQHADKIVTVYGNVEMPSVRAGDWVEAGQPIGSVPAPLDAGAESLIYFAVKHNGSTVDPAEVVPFD